MNLFIINLANEFYLAATVVFSLSIITSIFMLLFNWATNGECFKYLIGEFDESVISGK
tara:strand:+ start:845 stop:1018 length:174 start_codon:yes stop_codon:yes gene_type:complete